MAIEIVRDLPTTQPNDGGLRRMYILLVLILVGAFAWIDRQIFSIVLQSIKAAFLLSDTELGMVGGTAFGLFYVAVGLPLAWLADRFNRRNVIAASIAIWGAMTVLCGCTVGFWPLFCARVGVGIGEGGAAPASQSFVADLFPEQRRGMALGLLYSYVPLGYFISYGLGGWVNDNLGWRMAFVIFGLPGAALALLVRFTLPEPSSSHTPHNSSAHTHTRPAFWATLRLLSARKTIRRFSLAGACHAIGMVGASVWMPAFLIRSHGLSTTSAGLWLSMILGGAGLVGTLLGGRLADRLVRRRNDARWYPWVCAISLYLTVPFIIGVYTSNRVAVALALFVVPTICNHAVLGPSLAAVQNVADSRVRAMTAAFYLFSVNLLSTLVGPTLIGYLSDHLHNAFGNDALRYSLMGVVILSSTCAASAYLVAARGLQNSALASTALAIAASP